MPIQDPESWLPFFRALVDYHLPRIEAGAPLFGTCVVIVIAGLLLVFKSGAIARGAITFVGFLAGGAVGFTYASTLGASQPLAGGVAGLIAGWFAFRSYRLWLTLITAALALGISSAAQMDRPSLERVLIPPENISEVPALPTPQQQLESLKSDVPKRLGEMADRVKAQVTQAGPKSLIVPGIAAAIAIALAIKWARGIAVLWMSLAGALMAFVGGATGVVAQWPEARSQITANPTWVLGGIALLWLMGVVKQAREMPWMKKAAPAPAEKP